MNKLKVVTLGLFAVVAAFVASADTFYWKYDTVKNPANWKSFSDWQSWAVGTTADAGNTEERVPTSTDDLHYGTDHSWNTSLWMDLDGTSHELRHVVESDKDYGYRYLHLKNGTLTFNGSLTNSAYRINVYDTGKLVLASTSASRFGRGSQSMLLDVYSGGEAELNGKVDVVVAYLTVHEGGTLSVAATSLGSDLGYPNNTFCNLVNDGTLNLLNGFSFGGMGASTSTRFDLIQRAGTLNLGGNITCSSARTSLAFLLCGGTVNVTEDAAFVSASGNSAVKCLPQMTNNCSAVACVAANKTFDVSNMTFGEGTSLTKTGAGAIKVSSNLPTTLIVSEGSVEPASGANLGTNLSFAPGTTLRFAAPNISAGMIAGLENVTVTVADGLLNNACTLFSSSDPTLVAAVFAKLQAAGCTGLVNTGTAILYEKPHDRTIFAWKNEGRTKDNYWREGEYTWYSFLDPTSWLIGFGRAANTDGLVPNENDDISISDSYRPIFAMDMGGLHRKVRNLALNLGADPNHPGDMNFYPSQAGFRQFNVRNGTLEFTGSFTNVRAQVVAKDTGRFILGSTSAVRFGYNGAQNNLIAESGGEIDVYGLVDIHVLLAEVDAGGKMVFDPREAVTVKLTGNASQTFWQNAGTLEFPHGLTFSTCASANFRMLVAQNAGTLVLGGPIVREQNFKVNVDFTIAGGTVKATDDVSFTNLRTNLVEAGASVVFDVAEGKVLDVSTMTFGAGASVTKTGAGTIRFGTSLPDALSVEDGSVEYTQPVDLGDSLTLSADATLAFASDGISASSIAGIGSATVTATPELLAHSGVLFASADADLLATVLARLTASGVTGVTLSDTVLIHEIAHDASVFTLQSTATQVGSDLDVFQDASVYQRFFVPENWSVGRATTGANPNGWVPGEEDDLFINSQAPDQNYRPVFAFDMEGATRLVRNYDKEGAAERWGYNGFQIRNGTFGFTGTFASTRSVVIAQAGGRFVFGDDAVVTLGYQGAQCYGIAKAGGEIVLGGAITFNCYQAKVDAGGTMTIDPKRHEMRFTSTGSAPGSFIRNSGTLSLPSGLTFAGYGRDNSDVTLAQLDGFTLNLGGPLVHTLTTRGNFIFTMASGTINVSGATAITGFATCAMADDATVTVNVPKGSSLNLSEMTFGANTTIEKFGEGRIIFGASRPTRYVNHNAKPVSFILH